MFRIFTFKQLAIISFFLCLIMILGSFLNTLSPYVDDVASELERKKNEANALYEDNYSELGDINAEEE